MKCLRDVCSMATDKRCSEADDDKQLEYFGKVIIHSVILLSNMMNLKVGRTEEAKTRQFLRDVLFHSCDDDAESLSREFRLLYKDLASAAHFQSYITSGAIYLIGLSKALFCNNHFHLYDRIHKEDMQNTWEKNELLSALEDSMNNFNDDQYNQLSDVLNRGWSDSELQTEVCYYKQYATDPCAAAGCNNRGKFTCSGCKMTYYCSKKCQLDDWKVKHKSICKARRRNFG
mmetsp:Transcript_15089/g.22266  ORF Transcript_15089/g.22266 Transcript_15089/m.22266 type:complete len:230 (-) Transcript_15089:164-853(-)